MMRQTDLFKYGSYFSVFLFCLIAMLGLGGKRVVADEARLALKGYDPVAYFTMGRPVEGNARFEDVFDNVRYRFVSAKHLKLFHDNPDKYAPRYSGLCAMGLGAKGYKVEANPENWVIHDGRLYLTQQSFGPPIFRQAPERWSAAAAEHVKVLDSAPIGTGISWW